MNFYKPISRMFHPKRIYSSLLVPVLLLLALFADQRNEHNPVNAADVLISTDFSANATALGCDPDTEPPIISCPKVATVDCNTSLDPGQNPDLGTPTVFDLCDENPSTDFTDLQDPDFCAGGSFIRVWTATDQSGNAAQCRQIIDVEPDEEKPTIDFLEGLPEILFPDGTMTVKCDELPDFEDMRNWAFATDNCDDDPEIIFQEVASQTPNCVAGFPESLECIWYAVDNCGNESERLVVILFIVDDEPPVIECPPDVTVDCNTDLNPANQEGGNPDLLPATATDNCAKDLNPTFSDEGMPDFCQGGQIIRTWTVDDGCGNTDSCEQIITLTPDTEAPTIMLKDEFAGMFPNGVMVLECGDELPDFGEMVDWVKVDDNCDPNPAITFQDIVEQEDWFCLELGIVRRWKCTWQAVDRCGNESEILMTEIHIVDNTPPEIVCPPDVTVDCDTELNPDANPEIGFPEVRDICDEDPRVTFSDTVSGSLCAEQIILRTWTVTDHCGNSTSCTQTITVLREEEPLVIVDCPENDDLGCNPESLPEPDPDGFIVRKTCSTGMIEYEGSLYALTTGAGSWEEARAEALAAGGDLVAINDAAEQDFLIDLFGGTELFWIGLTDQDVEGTFVWSNGDMFIYDNWRPGEPNNSMPPPRGEDYVVMNWAVPGGWNDFDHERGDFPEGGVKGIIEFPNTNMFTVTVETIRNDTVGCEGTLIYRYTATDACGFSVSCDQVCTYTVDNEPPVITDCPADVDLGCNPSEIPPPPEVTATDNCGVADIRMTMTTTEDGCVRMITYRWVAVDECGNESEPCEQKVTYVHDPTPPQIFCPPGDDLGCNPAELPGPDPDAVGVEEGCTGPDLFEFDVVVEVVRDDTVGCVGTLIYRYSVVNFCGMEASCEQVYTYTVDNTPPTIDKCPDDMFFNCGPVEVPAAPLVTASDNCGVADMFAASSISISDDGCVETTVRTWQAVDICGNESEVCTQVITVVNDTGEISIECPPGDDLGCNPTSFPDPDPGAITASSFCSGSSFEYNGNYYLLTSTVGNWDAVRAEALALGGELVAINDQAEQDFLVNTFGGETQYWIGLTDQDSEGNFQWINGDPLTFTNWDDGEPNNATSFPAGEDYVVMNWDLPGKWNDLDINQGGRRGIVELTKNPLTVKVETIRHDTVGCVGTLVYQYRATDQCGNVATCTQTFTYTVDNEPPVITNCPQDMNLGWNPESIPDPPMIDAADNCGIDTIRMTADTLGDACDRRIVRRWVAVDDCGNVSRPCVQVITWQIDTEPPVIDCPDDLDLGWNPDEIPPFTKPAVSDNCSDPDEISITGREDRDQDGCLQIITRTWIAEDRCGNRDTCVQRIEYIFDETPPVFDCPDDIDLGCNPESIPEPVQPMVTDNCNLAEVTFRQDTVREGCEVTLIRRWSARDACNNIANCFQFVTWVVDTVAPVFEPLTDEVVVQCRYNDPEWSPLDMNLDDVVQITDDCSEVIVEIEDKLIAVGDCDEDGFIEMWECIVVASDLCGNRDTFRFKVTVVDTIPPVIMGEVEDMEVSSCDSIPPLPDIKVTDECDVRVAYHEDNEARECIGDYTLVRTWIATDACGNETTLTQRIFVRDETPPVIKFTGRLHGEVDGGERRINCRDLDKYLSELHITATDDCDPNPVIWFEYEVEDFGECQEDGATRRVKLNYMAMDDCGNSAGKMFFLRIVDTSPPVLVGVPEDTCAESLPPAPIVKATDECSSTGISVKMTQEGPFDCDEGTYYKRIWTATDICGNTAMAMQRITVNDGVAPEIRILNTGFENVMDGGTVEVDKFCDGELLVPPLKIVVFDACSQNITVTRTLESLGLPDEVPPSLLNRVLLTVTATDLCGNTTTLEIILEIIQTDEECEDEMPPSITRGEFYKTQFLVDSQSGPDQNALNSEPNVGSSIPATAEATPINTRIYPNPTTDLVYVDAGNLAGERGQIQVYNAFGQLIDQYRFDELPDTPVRINTSQYAAGMYRVLIRTENQPLQLHSLIIGRL